MNQFVVIISTLDKRAPHAWRLIEEAQQVATVVLVHTRAGSVSVPGTVTVDATDVGLHFQRWANLGLAECTGPTLIINDDIIIDAEGMAEMFRKLETNDLVTLPGRIGASPLTGWCFGLRPDRFRYDEAYIWHYGDDDIWERAKAEGARIGVANVAIVHDRGDHPNYPPELRIQVRQDRALFNKRWDRGTQARKVGEVRERRPLARPAR
jgi:hypothetical protein